MKKYITDRDGSLYRALEEYNRFIIAQYDINYEPHKFSQKTEKRIHRAINMRVSWCYDFVNTTAKRVAVIIATAIVALATATFSIEALREPFIDFIVKKFEQFSMINFITTNDMGESMEKIEYKNFRYIPDGFWIEREQKEQLYYKIIYVNNKGEEFCFKQKNINANETSVDTENGQSEKILISGNSAFLSSAKGYTQVFWGDGNYEYTIWGNLEKLELIKIAESIY